MSNFGVGLVGKGEASHYLYGCCLITSQPFYRKGIPPSNAYSNVLAWNDSAIVIGGLF